jgi:hypothetical protein
MGSNREPVILAANTALENVLDRLSLPPNAEPFDVPVPNKRSRGKIPYQAERNAGDGHGCPLKPLSNRLATALKRIDAGRWRSIAG